MDDEDIELNEELDAGCKAAEAVVEHMARMGASKTQWLVPGDGGMWNVTVEFVRLDG